MSATEKKLLRKLGASSRTVALLTLLNVNEGESLQSALSKALDLLPLGELSRRQATDLSYTLLRTEYRCETILERLFPRMDKLPFLFLGIIRCAISALLFQEGTPAYAVVNETVSDVKKLWGKGLDRVANGALRSLLRMGDAPLQRDFYGNDFAALCRFYSVPQYIGEIWRTEYGEEKAEQLLKKSFARPIAALRINKTKPHWERLVQELCEKGAKKEQETACYFSEGGFSRLSRAFLDSMKKEGRLSLQSMGSQLILKELGLAELEGPVWDACAGFGGKTCALLEAGAELRLASDTSWLRISHLGEECQRLGLHEPAIVLADASRPPLRNWDGNILLDAPCSGLGVLARRPDIKRRALDFSFYTKIQTALLTQAVQRIPVGKRVIYMTCTIHSTENELLVQKLLEQGMKVEIEKEWRGIESQFEGMYGVVLRKSSL